VTTEPTPSFADQMVPAIQRWAAQHPGVSWLGLMNAIDMAPDKAAIDRFLSNPEHRTPAASTE
jgi:hypothetical protein